MAARPTRISCALLLAASLFTPAPARADVDDEFTLVDEAFDPDQQDAGVFKAPKLPEVRLRAEVRGVYDQDFGSADVSSLRSGGVLRLLWPLSRRVVLGFIAGSEVEVFDFDGNKRFLNTGRTSGDPFDNLTATQFRIGGRYVVNEDWSINVVGFVTSRFEEDASFRDGVQGGGVLAANYTFRDRLTLLFGAGIVSRLDRSGVGTIPILGFSWKINDRLVLKSEGMGLLFSADLTDKLKGSLFGGWRARRYRLDDRRDGPTGVNTGSLRDRRALVGVGLLWQISQNWSLEAKMGSVVYRQFKVADFRGDEFDEVSGDPAFSGSLRLQFRFLPWKER
jgi:hypothetical protein